MPRQLLYQLLDHPAIYRLSQFVFAPGAERLLARHLEKLTQQLSITGRILDVGCGPTSWLRKVGGHPVGLDISLPYSVAYQKGGGTAVTGSAVGLPFASSSFDGVWSIGVFHHLPDSMVRQALEEMIRVCAPGGHVVVLDAVLPQSWFRPIASLVRRMDRGKFMRSQAALEALLLDRPSWSVSRFTYTVNGLEMLCCVYHASPTEKKPSTEKGTDHVDHRL
jgi:SAM-dependent methyltransferase